MGDVLTREKVAQVKHDYTCYGDPSHEDAVAVCDSHEALRSEVAVLSVLHADALERHLFDLHEIAALTVERDALRARLEHGDENDDAATVDAAHAVHRTQETEAEIERLTKERDEAREAYVAMCYERDEAIKARDEARTTVWKERDAARRAHAEAVEVLREVMGTPVEVDAGKFGTVHKPVDSLLSRSLFARADAVLAGKVAATTAINDCADLRPAQLCANEAANALARMRGDLAAAEQAVREVQAQIEVALTPPDEEG